MSSHELRIQEKTKRLFDYKAIIVSMVSSQPYLKRFEICMLIQDPIGKAGKLGYFSSYLAEEARN
jgi:hypothetical protein